MGVPDAPWPSDGLHTRNHHAANTSSAYSQSGYSPPVHNNYAPSFPNVGMENAGSASSTSARKRKAGVTDAPVIDLTEDSPSPSKAPRRQPKSSRTPKQDKNAGSTPPKKQAKKGVGNGFDDSVDSSLKKKARKSQDGRKRLRRWRASPPSAYREVRDRALTQRMFALDRQRSNDDSGCPTETISLAGTTGNIYTIVIDKVPSCDCPHARKGNQCKHIVYVLSRVLRAPAHLEYQLAFLTSELHEMFAQAPPLPSETASNDANDGIRKPVEGECPICCVDFEPESRETIIYCKAACGNNIHKECFSQWAATKTGKDVTCPFCRTPWQGDEEQLKQVAKFGSRTAEGYVNVASQLGLSGRRDYSSYHSYWVRNQARRGQIAWDDDGVMDHEY